MTIVRDATPARRRATILRSAAKGVARPVTRRFFFWTDRHIEAAVTPLYEQMGHLRAREERLEARLLEGPSGPQSVEARFDDLARRIASIEGTSSGLSASLPQILEALSTQNAWARSAQRGSAEAAQRVAGLAGRMDEQSAALDARLDEQSAALDARLDEQSAALDARLQEVELLAAERQAMSQTSFEDAYSHLARLAGEVSRVEQRLEFVRREITFEFRYGQSGRKTETVRTEILNPERLAAQDEDLRINLGCGHIPLDGYINVDARKLDGVDVVADIRALPFDKEQLAEIHSAHVLEHFPVEELSRQLLPYLHGLLRQDGTFSAVVPDAETMMRAHAEGEMSFEDLRLVTFGDQEYDGDFHFTMFSKAEMTRLLSDAGFQKIEFPVVGRRNGACFEMQVRASKTGAPAPPT